MPVTDRDHASPVPIFSRLERRLRTLADWFPELREAAETYRVLHGVLRDAPANAAPVAITATEAGRKLAAGEPLLAGAPLVFDLGATRAVAMRLAEALLRRGAAKAASVRAALARERFPMERLLRHAASGDCAFVRTLARVLAVDPALLDVVAQNAVKPALQAWSLQLAPLVRGSAWERGYCPVCGARAALAELRGSELSRHLRCGRCGADWAVRRLLCPFCGNENPSSLGFLHTGDPIEKARVEVCDGCREYLKVVTTFEAGASEDVLVEDLTTLPLDYAARAQGYTCRASHLGTRVEAGPRRQRGGCVKRGSSARGGKRTEGRGRRGSA